MNLGSGESANPALVLASAVAERANAHGLGAPRGIAKSAAIFDQGAVLGHAFVLASGLVKLVYATPDGNEWIKSLIVDQCLFGPSGPDLSAPIAYSAVAIEPSTIVTLPLDWLARELATSPDLQAAYSRFIDWVRQRKETREQALLCQSAEERYRDLLANEADLLARLSQADIARFLRITPVAFSRIKRRMRDG